ncbi:MAG: YkvA family protein [Salinibacter sp.]
MSDSQDRGGPEGIGGSGEDGPRGFAGRSGTSASSTDGCDDTGRRSTFAEVQIAEARDRFYRDIREVLDEWARDIGVDQGYAKHIPKAPSLLRLLENLALEEEVPARHKAQIAVVRAYFTVPRDAMPEEMVGPCGYVDDVALAALVADKIASSAGEEVVRRCWPEEGDPGPVIRDILGFARYAIGPEAWKTVRGELRAQVDGDGTAPSGGPDGDGEGGGESQPGQGAHE